MPLKKMGRPPAANPKDTRIYIRVDKETLEKLDECAGKMKNTRSGVVREGISMVYDKLK